MHGNLEPEENVMSNRNQQKNKGEKTMNQRAERINGLAAMIGVVAAMGSYAVTGQIIPGLW